MRFDVFSLFPQVIQPYIDSSILQRARENQLIEVNLHNIRDWTTDKHHVTDDMPYGGGGGMVMKAPPIFEAVESVLGAPPNCPLILMTPQGRPFSTAIAKELAALPHIAILCGRYEGVDERVREHLVTDQISVGDYVLTGGELPAMIIIDAVSRFLPGVLGDPTGAEDDSFSNGLLEYPHYTRPEIFRGWGVPPELLSGNHAEIARWRREQSIKRTLEHRPDLLENAPLSDKERKTINSGEEP
ncbi:MAG: tRNA (guanosine(37)-N1)-methyltransferase TrmD [Chloroflexi bacterium HGW-Chloroflexi-4]|jgi:tRNA (guanine37-N1)-methyltransferase|nr:MAG: tRNA (guanosine(37)-N1)-methyltransferase TrmD [Chloroflexi bacterium HGW-Chloroflexi-4]